MRHGIAVSIRNPLVEAHRFDEQHLLPGLAYIDLLYQTFARYGHDAATLELRDLAIHRPLIVAPGRDVALTIEATRRAGGEWSVQIDGRRSDDPAATPRCHAVATILLSASPPAFDEVLDWNAVQAAATASYPLHDIYEACGRHRLVHGPYMRAEGCVYVTDSAIYVDCQLGAEARRDAAALKFHPALIDASVVAVTAVLNSVGREQPYEPALPLSYDLFRAARTLTGACMARVRLDSVRTRNDLTYLSMDFFDLAGHKVAELGDFASKRLRPSVNAFGDADEAAPASPRASAAGSPPRAPTAPPPPVTGTPQPLADVVRELIARRARIATHMVQSDTSFYEMGIDSTGLLEIAHDIEIRIDRKLPPTLLFQYSTVDEVAEHLAGVLGTTMVDFVPAALQRTGPEPEQQPAPAAAAVPEPVRRRRRHAERRDIAVIGISGRFPQAAGIDALWDKLRGGEDCITTIPGERWDADLYFDPDRGEPGKSYGKWGGFIADVDAFDPLFFGMSPREAQFTDPQQRLFLETVWNLLEGSGYARNALKQKYRGRVGVYAGSMYSQYDGLQPDAPAQAVLQSFQSGIANRVSHYFGLRGPSVAVDTMCSSSIVALHLACADLRRGDCELAIAGAVNLTLDPRKYISLSQAQLLGSRFEGRSFGDSDGYLPAEAVGAVLLKPLARAEQDGDEIWAVVRSTATNHAGAGQAYSVPNARSQVQVIRDALRRAGASPASIGYIEAAASGSSLGDAIEVAALAQVFADAPCALGAVKSNIGHAEAASGITQLAKVLLQFRHGELVPTIHCDPPNPNLRLEETGLRLQRERAEWTRSVVEENGVLRELPRRALINAFGAGGTNASVVLEEYRGERIPVPVVPDRAEVVVLSARTATGLRAVAERMHAWLEDRPEVSLADLAYTLQECREAMAFRLAVVVADRNGLLAALRGYVSGADAGISGLYVGDPHGAAHLQQFAPGEQAQSLLETALAQRDLDRLALMWTRHLPVEWSALYGDAPMRRLALPTYPFERTRHWIATGAPRPPVADGGDAGPADAAEGLDPRTFIAMFLQHALGMPADALDPARPFREYGVDSVVGVSLVRALSQRFGIRLGGRVLLEHPNLDALVRHLDAIGRHPVAVGPIEVRRAESRPAAAHLRGALRDFKAGILTREQIRTMLERGMAA